jgi:hypothetical protein
MNKKKQTASQKEALPVLSPQRTERIVQLTMKQIETEKKPTTRRPVRIVAVAIAAAVLLCGSAAAAQYFGNFDFATLFGDSASTLEEAVTTYEPTDAQEAYTPLSSDNYVTIQDYNVLLLGNVEVTDTLIYASFEISRTSEEIVPYDYDALPIVISGYDTKMFYRDRCGDPRIVVYALLSQPLEENSTLTFTVGDETLLENVSVNYTAENQVEFSATDPDLPYVLDSASTTSTTLTATGHFTAQENDYEDALDASGTVSFGESEIYWPLMDAFLDTFDPADGNEHEDLEGYLVRREVGDDGTFTLEWAFSKQIITGATLSFGGSTYVIPEAEAETEPEIEPYTPNYVTTVDTKDFRFTLESMVSTSNAIYAIVDMTALTDYGTQHLDMGNNKMLLSASNMTHQANGSTGSFFLSTDGETTRYLVHSLAEGLDVNQEGDLIHFTALVPGSEDAMPRHYTLFDVSLTNPITTTITAQKVSDGTGSTDYTTVVISPLSLYLEGSPKTAEGKWSGLDTPTVVLTFQDGTSQTIMDSTWGVPATIDFSQYGVISASISSYKGTSYHVYLFSHAVQLEDLDTITIDGAVYEVNYEAE